MLNVAGNDRLRCPAVGILAGGRSQRMGFDKAGAMVDGVAMIVHVGRAAALVADRLYVLGRLGMEGWPGDLAAEFIPDEEAESVGPVAGILELLRACGSAAMVVGCDIPLIRAQSLRALWAFHCDAGDAVATLAVSEQGGRVRAEPVFAVYTPECVPLLESIAREGGSLQSLIDSPGVARFFVRGLLADELLNVNDRETLAKAEALMQARRLG